MSDALFITQHARDRFMKRHPKKFKTLDKAMERLILELKSCRPLRGRPDILYGNGWVFIVKQDCIITAMKPRKKWLMDLIYLDRNPK